MTTCLLDNILSERNFASEDWFMIAPRLPHNEDIGHGIANLESRNIGRARKVAVNEGPPHVEEHEEDHMRC